VLGILAAFIVGVGIGAAGGSTTAADSTTSVRTETQFFEETETVSAGEAEAALLEEEAARLKEERDRMKARAAKLDARAKDVRARERKVAKAERAVARSTFEDGTYLVGKDIPAGSYVAAGGPNCYWERSDPAGNIIDNNFGAGQARATVNSGELFNTQGCGTWRRG
jgi:hypothetical protein